jgi:hypothetical protein
MVILAIDPGPEKSAYLFYNTDTRSVISASIVSNQFLCHELSGFYRIARHMVIEMIASYGMPVGKDVFETCVWIGRFIQSWGRPYSMMYRQEVKLHLCKSAHAKDSNIRQALMDRHGSTREKAIGKKRNQGPLYDVKKDMWAALAVAVTYAETRDFANG